MKKMVALLCVLAVMWTVSGPCLFLKAPWIGLLCAIVPFPAFKTYAHLQAMTKPCVKVHKKIKK